MTFYIGLGNKVRTNDLYLGKIALYQLNYSGMIIFLNDAWARLELAQLKRLRDFKYLVSTYYNTRA